MVNVGTGFWLLNWKNRLNKEVFLMRRKCSYIFISGGIPSAEIGN